MPVYLFTYHAYSSWMPDRNPGYVRRDAEEVLPADPEMAEQYRRNAAEDEVLFGEDEQRVMIEAALETAGFRKLEIYFVATESSHIHVLTGWHDERGWELIRAKVREAIVRKLNADIQRRSWLADGASRKRVSDRQHFDYLCNEYLPDHRGWKWSRRGGWYR